MSSMEASNSKRENLVISKGAVGLGIAGLVFAVTASIAEKLYDHRQQLGADGSIKQALIQKFDTPQGIDVIPGTPLEIVENFPGQPIVYRMSGDKVDFMRPPTSEELRDALISTASEPTATSPEVRQ